MKKSCEKNNRSPGFYLEKYGMYLITKVGIYVGNIFFGVYRIADIGGGCSFRCVGNGGGKWFWCMENRGVSGDIIRKYTFECGARPTGAASI